MKAIDVLQEQWQAPAAALAAHAALGAGLYFGDKKSKEKTPDAVVTPAPLEKPTDPKKSTDAGTKVNDPKKEIPATVGKQDATSPEFFNKLKGISERLGIDKSDLLRIMTFETKGTLNPAIENGIGAVGLIQFMPDTAKGLGTSVQALKKMTAVQQLDYVEKFYTKNGVTAGMGLGDLYLMTFMPAAVTNNKPDNFVLGVDPKSKGWSEANKNAYPFPADPNKGLTLANIWRDNPAFRKIPESEKPPRDYFTVGDVKNHILSIRYK
jgi:hypothetical protein